MSRNERVTTKEFLALQSPLSRALWRLMRQSDPVVIQSWIDAPDSVLDTLFHPLTQPVADYQLPIYEIDTDARPFIPEGWSILSHQCAGKMIWGEFEMAIHYLPGQERIVFEEKAAREIQVGLADLQVMNANVLDFLLKRPYLLARELIVKAKLGYYFPFWGTIYRNDHREECVRCLYLPKHQGYPTWFPMTIDRNWKACFFPAAVVKPKAQATAQV